MDFKVYIKDGQEYFSFKQSDREKKISFEFPQSLMDLLELDMTKYGNLRDAQTFAGKLGSLIKDHVYFRLYRFLDISKLPKRDIQWVPSEIDMKQKQIRDLISNVLDSMLPKEPISKKMAKYYSKPNLPRRPFEFATLKTNYEMVDSNTFTEVLYPENIYDIIEFFVRKCIEREQKFKVCKSCGKYFAVTGHAATEYCSRMFKDSGKTCKEIGAVKVYQAKIADDDKGVMKEYNKAYKTRFARIKYKKWTKEEFQAWAEVARVERDKCMAGEISLEQFKEWLKRY